VVRKTIKVAFMKRLSKIERWERALWKEIHSSIFKEYITPTEMDKVQLAWYAEGVYDTVIRHMSFWEMPDGQMEMDRGSR
jgi:hypothetical protein